MQNQIEIFFKDLSPDVQQALLDLENLKSPEEANWDTIPLFYYEKSQEY